MKMKPKKKAGNSWTFPPKNMKFSPWQKTFIESYDPAIAGRWILCSARGIGKSTAAAAYLLVNSHKLYFSRPKNYPRAGHLARAVYIAPTTKNLMDTLNIFDSFLVGFPKNSFHKIKNQDASMTTYTFHSRERGIEIIFASATNHANFRGRTIDICVIDEMAAIGQRKQGGRFVNIPNASDGESLLNSVIEPACTRAFTNGTIILASTPNYGNFFDKMASSALIGDGPYKHWRVSNLPYTENIFLSAEQKAEIAEKEFYMPTKFRVEYMAEINVLYRDDSKSKMRQFSDELCANCFTHENTLHNSRGVYALGVDLAFRGADRCTFVVLDVYARTIVHLQHFATSEPADIVKKILELKKLFGISASKIAIDITGKGICILPMLPTGIRDDCFKIRFNGLTKKTMYDSLTARLGIDLKIPYFKDFDFGSLPHCLAPLPDISQSQKNNFELLYSQFIDFWRVDYPKFVNGVEQIYSEWVQSAQFGDDYCDGVAMVTQFLPPIETKKQVQNGNNGKKLKLW